MKPRTRIRNLAPLLLASFFTMGAAVIHAQNLITNGGFENTGGTFVDESGGVMNTTLTVGSTIIPGWTVTSDQLGWISNGNIYGPATPFGSFLVDLTGSHDNGSYAGVTQTISTTPAQTYTLSLSLGADQDHPVNSGTKSVSVAAGVTNKTFTFIPTGSGNQWGTFSFDFVATSSSTAITIVGTGAGSGYQYLALDNVSVVPRLPTLTITPTAPGQGTISWTPATPGYVLQEGLSLSPTSWTNSPSGATNPITVSVTLPMKFYRLFHP
jgi:hypothetical protein